MNVLRWLRDLLSPVEPPTKSVVEDLLTWEEENDRLLPNNLTADDIAAFESAGWIVDLETGRLIREEDANDYGVL